MSESKMTRALGDSLSTPREGTFSSINHAWANSVAYAHSREALVNSIEAWMEEKNWEGKDRPIKVTVRHKIFVGTDGKRRLAMVDDGPGMYATVHQTIDKETGLPDGSPSLQTTLSTVNFGTKQSDPSDTSGNHGMGLKSSLVPWNKHGVIFVARKHGITGIIHYADGNKIDTKDIPDADVSYQTINFCLPDASGIEREQSVLATGGEDVLAITGTGVDAADHLDFPVSKGVTIKDLLGLIDDPDHGFAVVCLGNSPDDETIFSTGRMGSDSRAIGSSYSRAKFLNRRIWKFHAHVFFMNEGLIFKDSLYTKESGTKRWDTIEASVMPAFDRIINWVKGGITQHGIVEIGPTENFPAPVRAHWFLLPDTSSKKNFKQGAVRLVKGFIAAVAREGWGEELYHVDDNPRRANLFGIPQALRERIVIAVEPPRASGRDEASLSVQPDNGRSNLQIRNQSNEELPRSLSSELVWMGWGAEFALNMPEVMSDFFNEEEEKNRDDAFDKSIKAGLDAFNAMWTPILPVDPSKEGDEAVKDGKNEEGGFEMAIVPFGPTKGPPNKPPRTTRRENKNTKKRKRKLDPDGNEEGKAKIYEGAGTGKAKVPQFVFLHDDLDHCTAECGDGKSGTCATAFAPVGRPFSWVPPAKGTNGVIEINLDAPPYSKMLEILRMESKNPKKDNGLIEAALRRYYSVACLTTALANQSFYGDNARGWGVADYQKLREADGLTSGISHASLPIMKLVRSAIKRSGSSRRAATERRDRAKSKSAATSS